MSLKLKIEFYVLAPYIPSLSKRSCLEIFLSMFSGFDVNDVKMTCLIINKTIFVPGFNMTQVFSVLRLSIISSVSGLSLG